MDFLKIFTFIKMIKNIVSKTYEPNLDPLPVSKVIKTDLTIHIIDLNSKNYVENVKKIMKFYIDKSISYVLKMYSDLDKFDVKKVKEVENIDKYGYVTLSPKNDFIQDSSMQRVQFLCISDVCDEDIVLFEE